MTSEITTNAGTEDLSWIKQYTILYVDDEEDNQLVFRATFGNEFNILVASNGPEALQLLSTEKISVVVTDHRMPQMTGVDLCEQIRLKFPTVRCMLMTAYADMHAVVDAINRGGVHAYVLKPWDPDHLRQLLIENLQFSYLKNSVGALNASITEKERQLHIAVTRAKVLHDVANATFRFTNTFEHMSSIVDRNEDKIPAPVVAELRSELDQLHDSIVFITKVQNAHKTQQSDVKVRLENIPVNQLLQVVRSLAEPFLSGTANLVFNCPPNVRMFADRTSICRILINLVKHARESINEAGIRHGLILIDVYEQDNNVVFTVADNGPGIPAAERDKVFTEQFTTKGGTGAGLMVARSLTEDNKGTLELIDSYDMPGATFRLTLPAREEIKEPVRGTAAAASDSSAGRVITT
jgi:two-component system, NtrC family, sensor kinase